MKRTAIFDAYDVIVTRIGNDKVTLAFCTNGKTDFTAKIPASLALRLAAKVKESAVPVQTFPVSN